MNIFRILPSYVLAILLEFIGFVSYNLYLNFSPIKIDKANFGYGLITNVSSFGLQTVLPSHVRMARTLIVQTINEPRVIPVVKEGKVVPQKTMKIGFCFDPRFGNGDDFLECLSKTKEVWDNPEKFF